MLALDGAYVEDSNGCIRFCPVAPPSDREVARMAERIARRIKRLMKATLCPVPVVRAYPASMPTPMFAVVYTCCFPACDSLRLVVDVIKYQDREACL
jgi:hypothetical protein